MKHKISKSDMSEFADKYCFDIQGFNKKSFINETMLVKRKVKGEVVIVPKDDALEKKWYKSLENKNPDYSIYDDIAILPNIWACWASYSRIYITSIFTRKTENKIIADVLGKINTILDVGNGIGYSTAYLKESFPKAKVIGHNIKDSFQYKICKRVGKEYGFKMIHDINSVQNIDLLFASEYFEHFERPIEHLKEILIKTNPKIIIIANAFGADSTGHFNNYINKIGVFNSQKIQREFNKHLKFKYKKLLTSCWNDRPNFWIKK